MSDPFLAEIRILPYDFPPKGWAFCDGQSMSISQNTALFSLIGTYYGGNGTVTFALPNLQGMLPMHQGQGPGLSERFLGETGGTAEVDLDQTEMPFHSHSFMAANPTDFADLPNPAPDRVVAKSQNALAYQTDIVNNLVPMSPQAIQIAGVGLPHTNLMPYMTLNFCIALQGIFPPRV